MVFVETSLYSSLLNRYLSDDEYAALQNELATHPNAGSIIPGTGGLRKIRFHCPGKGKGKRSGVRIIYYWYTEKDRIYLLSIYYKGEVADLTSREKKTLKQLVEAWKNEQA
jgi:mRNA-degrading endonuclease RelE of RelBE toxin-antitoxin system